MRNGLNLYCAIVKQFQNNLPITTKYGMYYGHDISMNDAQARE